MRLTSSLKLDTPQSRIQFYVNDQIQQTVCNTITHRGVALLSTPSDTPLAAPNGGKLAALILGSGTDHITFDTDHVTDRITALGNSTVTSTVTFSTDNAKRYADITLFYNYTAATSDVTVRQFGIFPNHTNSGMLFGSHLHDGIVVETGDVLKVAYSIRIQIISQLMHLDSTTYAGSTVELYGAFHREAGNSLYVEWPVSTSGTDNRTASLSRFYANNNLLATGSGVYRSTWTQTHGSVNRTVRARVLSNNPGSISFTIFEFANHSTAGNDYTLRAMINPPLQKDSDELFDIEINLDIQYMQDGTQML